MAQALTASNSHSVIATRPGLATPLPLLLLAGLLAHLPFVLQEIPGLWNSEHYSFFPLALFAFGWIVWERLDGSEVKLSPQLSVASLTYIAVNLALLSLAFFAQSNWLGWLSFLFFVWTAANVLLTAETVARIRGAFVILCLIVPLPLNLDSALVISLQKMATEQASLLLDFTGLFHSVSGVAVQLPEKQFQIDDACSGIRSLFSAITTMLVFAVYCRYGAFRMIVTLLQTCFWVLVVNSFRVFLIVYAYHRWDAGLESGWKHDALGFASYLTMILFAISTDQFLRFVMPTAPPEAKKKEQAVSSTGRSMRRYSDWIGHPFGRGLTNCFAVLFLCGFALITTGGIVRAMSQPERSQGRNFQESLAFNLEEQSLPENLGGWKRVGFEGVVRDKSDPFGKNSLIWTFARDGMVVQFSIDGAYASFHDLWYCYSSVGWDLRNSRNRPLESTAETATPVVATEYELYRGATENAFVIYTCLDSRGVAVEPPPPAETAYRRLLNRLRSGQLLTPDEKQSVTPPVIQFQLFSSSASEYRDDELQQLRLFFANAQSAAQSLIKPASR